MNSKEVLTKWLDGWKDKDTKQMLNYSQLSWIKSLKYEGTDPHKLLKDWWGVIELKSYLITGKKPARYKNDNGGYDILDPEMKVIFDYIVEVVVVYKNTNYKSKETRLIRMILEDKDGNSNKDGKFWGVSPPSVNRTI